VKTPTLGRPTLEQLDQSFIGGLLNHQDRAFWPDGNHQILQGVALVNWVLFRPENHGSSPLVHIQFVLIASQVRLVIVPQRALVVVMGSEREPIDGGLALSGLRNGQEVLREGKHPAIQENIGMPLDGQCCGREHRLPTQGRRGFNVCVEQPGHGCKHSPQGVQGKWWRRRGIALQRIGDASQARGSGLWGLTGYGGMRSCHSKPPLVVRPIGPGGVWNQELDRAPLPQQPCRQGPARLNPWVVMITPNHHGRH
jgi:hypothetical protein